jgi:hypothetical protein
MRLSKRARPPLALAASLGLHALVTLGWRGPRPTEPAPVPPAPARAPITFELIPPALARQPIVVVVGPGAAGRGGSLSGGLAHAGARAVTRPAPAHAPTVTPSPPAMQTALSAPAAPTLGGAAPADRAGETPVVTTARADDAPIAAASRDGPPAPAAEPTFEDLIQAQGLRLAVGRGAGRGGFGAGDGRAGLALAIDLSGRGVADSRVAAPPVVVEQRRITCELAPGRLRAVVRLLVLRDGTAAAPRLLEPSGQATFDSCALRYAQNLRFAPGVDGAGHALDVWIHVGVTPAATNRI